MALSDDGSLLSAVGNSKTAGKVFVFANGGTSGQQLWTQPTKHNPNSSSIDSAGSYVTVADGYPDKTPGDFYLFNSDGTLVGSFATSNMSWPMQISADASAIAAGSDDSEGVLFLDKIILGGIKTEFLDFLSSLAKKLETRSDPDPPRPSAKQINQRPVLWKCFMSGLI